MKRIFFTLAAWLIAATAAAAVTIAGPNTLDTKEAALLYIEGMSADQFAGEDKSTIAIYPDNEQKPIVVVLQSLGNQPVIYVQGQHAGAFALILDVNMPGAFEIVIHELTIGGEPDPPDPPIPPDPPVPGAKYNVVILYETDQLDDMPASQLLILNSLQFREKLQAAGHKLLAVLDRDAKGNDGKNPPTSLAAYFGVCDGDDMPRIVITPLDGQGKPKDFNLPLTEAKVFELLEKGGE